MRHHYGWVVHRKTTSVTPLSVSSHKTTGWNILGATEEAQRWSMNPSFRRVQDQKTTFLFYSLQLKSTMYRTEEIFFFFCPFAPRYPMDPHTCTRASLVTWPIHCPSCSSGFPTAPLAKYLLLATPGCYPCAAFPTNTEIRDQNLLLLQQVCKPLPQNKLVFSYTLIFHQRDFTNSLLIPDDEIAPTIGCRKEEVLDWVHTSFYSS